MAKRRNTGKKRESSTNKSHDSKPLRLGVGHICTHARKEEESNTLIYRLFHDQKHTYVL